MGSKKKNVGDLVLFVVDLIGLLIAFILAVFIRYSKLSPDYMTNLYGSTLFVLLLAYVVIFEADHKRMTIFQRGFGEEGIAILKDQLMLLAVLVIYLYVTKQGGSFSRLFVGIFFVINYLISYVLRSYLKVYMLAYYKKSISSNKVLLITTSDRASEVIQRIRNEHEWSIQLSNIAIVDKDMIGEKIEGILVLGSSTNLIEIARLNVVDEVFINLPYRYDFNMNDAIYEFEKMGVIVHANIEVNPMFRFKEKSLENFAGHQVITFSTGIFDPKQEILKRIIDIAGGLVGLLITAILTLFLAPAIKIDSKGPVFFSQVRVGKNGRKFKIYKFRSMYIDAEERKKELMEQNEMQGLMFKMTDDPRITKIGKFIRKTSLDEFPQFLNVLKGDMSLVGTRPPTQDEFVQYEARHKRRLNLRPGLTGLWQVSGRSDIQDFEEVVRLDLEYIDNWNIGLDVKLILKTVGVVVFGRGSR